MMKTIGILGGMGPMATVDFMTKLYQALPVENEQEHLRVLVDSNPAVPDRTLAILHNEPEPVVSQLTQMAQGLINQGAHLLAVACNTAHYFLPVVERNLSIEFVNMISVTLDAVSDCRQVGVLATDGTLAAGLYRRKHVPFLYPDAEAQKLLMTAIYGFKAGEVELSRQQAKEVYRHLKTRGAETVIAACTELPLLLEGVEIIDPGELLARKLVEMAVAGER
ncbi:MAG: amino acid racemase [Firmicutes bacterium]|nr:amino acid racemase [Bacillota bacterium]